MTTTNSVTPTALKLRVPAWVIVAIAVTTQVVLVMNTAIVTVALPGIHQRTGGHGRRRKERYADRPQERHHDRLPGVSRLVCWESATTLRCAAAISANAHLRYLNEHISASLW